MDNNLLLENITNDPEVVSYCHETNAETWGSDLYTTDQYIEREKHLKAQAISSNPKIDKNLEPYRKYLGTNYFSFKDLSIQYTGKCSQIVASVETLNRVGYIKAPYSNEEIAVLSVCIGGVYTPSKYRGKGYASAMIKQLNKWYDDIALKNPQDQFLKHTIIFLYSEVGKFYEKLEYHSRHIPVHYFGNDSDLLSYVKALSETKTVEPLDLDKESTSLNVCMDSELMECEETSNSTSLQDKYRFYVKPDLDIFRWFKARDTFIANIAYPSLISRHPLVDGYKLSDSKSHIIWHHNWNDNALYVLKLFIENDSRENLITLLVKALEELRLYNIKKLAIWNEDLNYDRFSDIFDKFKNDHPVHTNVENGSLSAIRANWIDDINNLEWINNGKYPWF